MIVIILFPFKDNIRYITYSTLNLKAIRFPFTILKIFFGNVVSPVSFLFQILSHPG